MGNHDDEFSMERVTKLWDVKVTTSPRQLIDISYTNHFTAK